jgi:hypothetical protein
MSATHTRDDQMRKQLDSWCRLFEGCTRIEDLESREHATALGVIRRLRYIPGERMEAIVSDGTGRLRAVWSGPEVVDGLELGRGLRLEGTVCADGGELTMRNPTWCLVRDPYECAGDQPGR